MSLTVWRITKRKHAKTAFEGIGARKYGGRWNNPGTSLVYTAQSQSLAALEILVHLNGPELLEHYVLIPVTVEEIFIHKIAPPELPRNWRANPAPSSVRKIGDEWARSGTSAVLQVPSALLPAESNFLLNPVHADFKKLEIGAPILFKFDSRLSH